jgi:hypothetical protein
VPFEHRNPLEDFHIRMRGMAGQSSLVYPAAMLGGVVGETRPDASAADRRVRASRGLAGIIAAGPNVPLAAGAYSLATRLRLDSPTGGEAVTLVVRAGDRTIAERRINGEQFIQPGRWSNFTLDFKIDSPIAEHVAWEVSVPCGVLVSIDTFTLPVHYDRLDVLDLTAPLNTFDTHASIFDAHPNPRAHAVIAAALADWVKAQDRQGVLTQAQ